MTTPLDPNDAAAMFYGGHPMVLVSDPTDVFVCGQWMGELAWVTKIPFADRDGAVAFFTDNPAVLAERSLTPPGPPVNQDAPYVEQVGDTLTCTSGIWQDPPPDTRAYQWQSNGAAIGTDSSSYTVTGADVGNTFDCVLTGSNVWGATPVTSNSVVVAAPSGMRRRSAVSGAH